MPSHLLKFYETKDEDPSRHMKRYMKRLASSFVTNLGYLVGVVSYHSRG
jgi:hypothetical protein